jgi:signal transduction histidine kinase
MVGRRLGEFLHPEDHPATAAEVARLAQGAATLAFENRYRTRRGEYRLLSWTAVPEAGFIHAVGRDVTRERATEEALRQSQKLEAIGQLTGGVAHDFNNELAVIRTSIDLLHRLEPTDVRRGRFMDAMSNAVTRATKLTSQLLAFARRQALQPSVFDAAINTRAAGEMISSLTGERIELELDLPEQGCFVYADPNQFDTALVNLALNARDAMQGRGRLRIRITPVDGIPGTASQPRASGDFVAVSVADTGCGITAENLNHIFEPFFTTKQAGQGTGLGLSQVFGFAKQSGGDIHVRSEVEPWNDLRAVPPSRGAAPRRADPESRGRRTAARRRQLHPRGGGQPGGLFLGAAHAARARLPPRDDLQRRTCPGGTGAAPGAVRRGVLGRGDVGHGRHRAGQRTAASPPPAAGGAVQRLQLRAVATAGPWFHVAAQALFAPGSCAGHQGSDRRHGGQRHARVDCADTPEHDP